MPTVWFYRRDGQKFGPISSAQLKAVAASGELRTDDQVWREGLTAWVRASAVAGLFAATADETKLPAVDCSYGNEESDIAQQAPATMGFFAKVRKSGHCEICDARLSFKELRQANNGGRRRCAKCLAAGPALNEQESPPPEAIEVLSYEGKTVAAPGKDADYNATAMYVTGPWNLKQNTLGDVRKDGHLLTFTSGILKKQTFKIPFTAMLKLSITTVDQLPRVTASRLLLVGVYALAWQQQKRQKFLHIEFTDDTGMEVSAVFAKSSFCTIDTLHSRVLAARLDFLKSSGGLIAKTGAAGSVSAAIEELGTLREKGLITDEEFQKKKSEMLARM